ncbi:MAG: tRNA (adenosine(37)-N6)-threonylcarbamoyltransferase complex ATPase subunit type 1 TsaE [bacterium]|nr:tRNA (adenosine(37)-N6)-threonylcarbamoyltransferase complex ATPase subunit type 1 TsaE [bacterium]
MSYSPEDTFSIGNKFADSLLKNDVVGLFGNLGSGKTQFVKGICNYFGVNDNVSSPTFVIVNEYEGTEVSGSEKFRINHFDLYRLKDSGEFKEIGVESYSDENSICLIEWAELAEKFLKLDMKKIYFEYGENENERIIKFIC